jgi:cytochrome c oxidase subunit I+III
MAAIMFSDRVEEKHFADAEDISFYWYFLVGVWIPLYALVFLGPRLI